MIQKNILDSEEQIKRLFVRISNDLETLNEGLRELQSEVQDEDLQMTITLIEGKKSLDKADLKLLAQYSSVALMEVSYFLSDIVGGKKYAFSDEGIDTLKKIGYNLKALRMTSKFLQVNNISLDESSI